MKTACQGCFSIKTRTPKLIQLNQIFHVINQLGKRISLRKGLAVSLLPKQG